MSEEILKALMQLFAIIAKQDDGATQSERKFVEEFLYFQLSEDLVKEYAVNDIIILNGIYSSNTPNHIERLLDIIELKDGVKNTFKKKKRKKKEEDSTIPLDSLQVDVDTTSVID